MNCLYEGQCPSKKGYSELEQTSHGTGSSVLWMIKLSTFGNIWEVTHNLNKEQNWVFVPFPKYGEGMYSVGKGTSLSTFACSMFPASGGLIAKSVICIYLLNLLMVAHYMWYNYYVLKVMKINIYSQKISLLNVHLGLKVKKELGILFIWTITFLAHLSWKLKQAILIACHTSVCLSVNFSHFHVLLQSHWANFNQTWNKASHSQPSAHTFASVIGSKCNTHNFHFTF